ncbi:MAG: DUF1559 domain-containing protein [Thermoguttaceae bacterium]
MLKRTILTTILSACFFSQVFAATDLAPILDSKTIFVVRGDLKKVDVPKVVKFLGEQTEQFIKDVLPKGDSAQAIMMAKAGLAYGGGISQSFVKDLLEKGKADELFIISYTDASEEMMFPFMFAVPAPEGKPKEEIAAIRKVFAANDLPITFARHGFVIGIPNMFINGPMGDSGTDRINAFIKKKFGEASKEVRPEFAKEFAAHPEAAAQLVFGSLTPMKKNWDDYISSMGNMAEHFPAPKPVYEFNKKYQSFLLENFVSGSIVVNLAKPGVGFYATAKNEEAAKKMPEVAKEWGEMIAKSIEAEQQSGSMQPVGVSVAGSAMLIISDLNFKADGNTASCVIDSSNFDKIKTKVLDVAKKISEETQKNPAVQAAAMQRSKCSNNLKQISLAFHNYHDTHNAIPPAYTTDKDGKPLHSWRVLILPFIEEQALYSKIRLDEPWDSEHNKQFHDKMPAIFACPDRIDASGDGDEKFKNLTDYSVVIGDDTTFGETPFNTTGKGCGFGYITDGLSNTLLAVERVAPVNWMCPDQELTFEEASKGINQDPKGIGSAHNIGANSAFCDGSVKFILNTVKPEVLKAMLTKSGGESTSL